MKELKRKDLGTVGFGVFKGKKWSEMTLNYLNYIISSECNTSKENKDIARQEIEQRSFVDGQLELF